MGTTPAVFFLSLNNLVLSGSHDRPLAVQSLVDRMDNSWTILEERDLVTLFGADYQVYQNEVPMLIPNRIPSR